MYLMHQKWASALYNQKDQFERNNNNTCIANLQIEQHILTQDFNKKETEKIQINK